MTICPCCGFEFEGDLRQGCVACGARAVGDPLPRPAHILPAYGRPLLLVVIGTLMVLSFIVEIIFALVKQPLAAVSRLEESWMIPVDLWSLLIAALIAAERAAWHLKWVLIPVSFVVLWSSSRIYKSMQQAPARFVGMRAARRGLMASALVCLLVATLIGVTIPRRLREHQMAIDSGNYAPGYTLARALLEYRARYGTLPTELKDLTKTGRLPDPDGSIAAAIASVGQTDYKPTATLAELPKEKSRTLAGAVIRKTSANAGGEDAPDAMMSFTDYELRLPGEDGILNTDDDLIVRDGVILKASEVEKPTTLTAAPLRKP